uniref:Gap junction protein n=1 Tax=Otolemur garnettii TaxID=30611 RepID=A0A654ICW2_OTOGA|nr:TPA: connexin H1 [Otolemur garnettii]
MLCLPADRDPGAMVNWDFFKKLLKLVKEHSTVVGRIHLTVLIIRILIFALATNWVWGDEQLDFKCSMTEPGCTNVCYNQAFPISPIRYWVLQFFFISTPTLVYLGHVMYYSWRKKQRQKKKEVIQAPGTIKHQMSNKSGRRQIKGALKQTYVATVLWRSVLEAGFLYGQWHIYGWTMEPAFSCHRAPCPYVVECFVSHPLAKTVFMIFMLLVGLMFLVLNIVDLVYLWCVSISPKNQTLKKPQDTPPVQGTSSERFTNQVFIYLTHKGQEPSSPSCPTDNAFSSSEENRANLTTEERLDSSRTPLSQDPTP